MSLTRNAIIISLITTFFSCQRTPETTSTAQVEVVEELLIDSVWSGHPVGFALLTQLPHQFVAYYDHERTMVVAHRTLDQDQWEYQPLPEKIGWDSHNYISMALDEEGYLHLSGNMHGDTLNYYRTGKPYDISSFQQVPQMIGEKETRVTYPEFFYDPEGQLIFTYRDGGSGQGDQIYNWYDVSKKEWRRLLDTQLVDGKGEMNAYLHGPVLGPDGYYHLIWVWRDTPDAATNHDLSYAKSKDLITWFQSDGTPQPLPITYDNTEIIDPVPARGGMINGNTVIGFDHQQRPVVTYHKYDSAGNTQIYNARLENGGWKIYQATDWDFRWDFGGFGSIVAEVGVSPVEVGSDGRLIQEFYSDTLGRSRYILDRETLSQLQEISVLPVAPEEIYAVTSDFPGMQVNVQQEKRVSAQDSSWYVLRWETLSRNRDQEREGPLPPPSGLTLYHVVKATVPIQ